MLSQNKRWCQNFASHALAWTSCYHLHKLIFDVSVYRARKPLTAQWHSVSHRKISECFISDYGNINVIYWLINRFQATSLVERSFRGVYNAKNSKKNDLLLRKYFLSFSKVIELKRLTLWCPRYELSVWKYSPAWYLISTLLDYMQNQHKL